MLNNCFVSVRRTTVLYPVELASTAKFTYFTFCGKTEVNFSHDISQTFNTHRVYNQSTVIVKWSSIKSDITFPNSNTRHE